MSMNKTDMIRAAFYRGEHLTHLKAIAYGTYRLADVVFRLKKQGMNIVTEIKHDGTGEKFAEYHLARTDDERPIAA